MFEHDKENDKLLARIASTAHTHAVTVTAEGGTDEPSAVEDKTVSIPMNILFGFLAAPTKSTTKYISQKGEEAAASVVAPWINGVDCSITGFHVAVGTAPGTDKKYSLELMVNGEATGIKVEISGTETSGVWEPDGESENPIDIEVGDVIAFKSINDNGNAANVSFSLSGVISATVEDVPTADHTHDYLNLDAAVVTGSGGTTGAATEVSNGTNLSSITGVPFFAWGR